MKVEEIDAMESKAAQARSLTSRITLLSKVLEAGEGDYSGAIKFIERSFDAADVLDILKVGAKAKREVLQKQLDEM